VSVDGNRNTLVMTPETDIDSKVLSKLIGNYKIAGFGKDAKSGDPLHVQLQLEEKGEN